MTRALLASLAALAAVIFTVTAQDKEKPKDDKPVARNGRRTRWMNRSSGTRRTTTAG